MKRLVIALWGLAAGFAPGLALGQTVLPGQVQVHQDEIVDKYFGTDECTPSAADATLPVRLSTLEWTIAPTAGTFSQQGTYRIIATNKLPTTTTGTNGNNGFCLEADDTQQSIKAKVIRTITATNSNVTLTDLNGLDVAAAVGYTGCGTTDGDLFICVHWYDANSNRVGKAISNPGLLFTNQTPGTVTLNSLTSGDSALNASWSAPNTDVIARQYELKLTAGTEQVVNRTTSRSLRVRGLRNGVEYSGVVTPIGNGGNRGPTSDPPLLATPLSVLDYSQYYQQVAGGTDNGGCASGPAGLFALGGLALLLAMRRRSA